MILHFISPGSPISVYAALSEMLAPSVPFKSDLTLPSRIVRVSAIGDLLEPHHLVIGTEVEDSIPYVLRGSIDVLYR